MVLCTRGSLSPSGNWRVYQEAKTLQPFIGVGQGAWGWGNCSCWSGLHISASWNCWLKSRQAVLSGVTGNSWAKLSALSWESCNTKRHSVCKFNCVHSLSSPASGNHQACFWVLMWILLICKIVQVFVQINNKWIQDSFRSTSKPEGAYGSWMAATSPYNNKSLYRVTNKPFRNFKA